MGGGVEDGERVDVGGERGGWKGGEGFCCGSYDGMRFESKEIEG